MSCLSDGHGLVGLTFCLRTRSRFVNMPQELVNKIVAYLGEGVETACLALTCGYFFRLLAPAVRSALIKDAAPWAGDRLIFVGDYAEDYPSDVVTDDEMDDWKRWVIDTFHGREGYDGDASNNCEFDPYEDNPLYFLGQMRSEGVVDELALEDHEEMLEMYKDSFPFKPLPEFKPLQYSQGFGFTSGALVFELKRNFGKKDRTAFAMARRLLQRPMENTEVVLRNLTTKEYVRESRFAHSKYALGEVVYSTTMWTADGSGTLGSDYESAWKGHRFDIVSSDLVQGEEWTDRTQDMYRFLKETVGECWGDFGDDSDDGRAYT